MRRGRATPGSSQRPLHTRGLALEPRTPPRHARWVCITSSLKESRPSHRGSERVSVLSKLTQQGQVFKQKKNLIWDVFLVTSQGPPLCHKEPSLPMGQSQDPSFPLARIRAYGQLGPALSGAVCVSLPSHSRRGAMLAGVECTPGCRFPPPCVDTAGHAAQPPVAGSLALGMLRLPGV